MKIQTIRIIPKNTKTIPQNLPLLAFAFFMVFSLSFLVVSNLKKSNALSVSNFRAGNIISDYTMSNTSTMNEKQIQEFLTQKNPCGDTNIWRANHYSGYKYHIENGKFVCLSQETFEYNGVKQTAAQVIYEAARDYRINPQVLLVLIEKEQSLVSDTWPNSIQYRSATGFGCPDTAECDSKYYGFRNQVRHAAKLFRDVLDGGYTNYPVGQNFIYYNPNFACGGSQVYIENLATSALYRYTPYQPNTAAIANYPGTSYCGAYGNRNFYALFLRWFGDPTTHATSKATTAIWERYLYLDKELGVLGKTIGNTYEYKKDGQDYSTQQFEHGYIVSTPTGAWENYGAIRGRWAELGYEGGSLGYPLSGIYNYQKDNKNYSVQRFEHGYIIGTPNGAFESNGEIRQTWATFGYEAGYLGYPMSNVTKKGNLETQKYDNGAIVKQQNEVSALNKAIYDRWQELDAESGILGTPMGSTYHYQRDGKNYSVQRFTGGYILGTPKGAFESYGEIRERWASLGYEAGALGYPSSRIVKEHNKEVQKFVSGSITKTPEGISVSLDGQIYRRWQELQGESGILGDTIGDTYHYKKNGQDYSVQRYNNGYILGTPSGAWESYGAIRQRWAELGYEAGILGYPASGIYNYQKNGKNYSVQRFEHGYILGTPEGAFESYGEIRERWASLGFEAGFLGYPTSPITHNDGKSTQKFEHGEITI